ILELFTAMREATKEIVQQSGQQLMRMGSCSGLDNILTNSQQYEVMYIGKVKVAHKRAPPSFIDEAVEKFNESEAQNSKIAELESQNATERRSQNSRTLSEPAIVVNNPLSALPRSFSSLTTCAESEETNFKNQAADKSSDSLFVNTEINDFSKKVVIETVPDNSKSKVEAGAEIAYKHQTSTNNLHLPVASLIPNTQSLDDSGRASIIKDLRNYNISEEDEDECKEQTSRVRSSSGDIPRTAKQSSLPYYRSRTDSGGSEMKRNRTSVKLQNKTMLFLIGRLELCLISPDRHQVLLSKTFNYVSHCCHGLIHRDHFGFICKETTFNAAETYVGYVFKCQSEKLVEEIMHALKQAFHNAHQSYQTNRNKSTIICETCPMHWFHRICCDVESLTPHEAQTVIFLRLESLSEHDQTDIMSKYHGINVNSIQEQNEILMMLLRKMCERKQMKHTHEFKERPTLEKRVSSSTLDHLKQKAKKSISNSFETILKPLKTPPKDEMHTRFRSASIDTSDRSFACYMRRKLAHGDSSELGTSPESLSPSSTSSRNEFLFPDDQSSRPRSSTIGGTKDLRYESAPKMSFRSESIPLNQTKSPLFNIFSKIGSQNKSAHATVPEESPRSTSPATISPHSPSWRKTIFTNVQKTSDQSSIYSNVKKNVSFYERKKLTKEDLRALWKKAINEHITLIRMEKENKKLQANQNVASNKRLKLDYKEINVCSEENTKLWDIILKDINADKIQIFKLVKNGVPKHKRGEIWMFLAQQQKMEMKGTEQLRINLDTPYRELLQNLTEQQHAILVDLGRTFPKHPYYAQPLGAGQLSLFNLLKAYSLFDKEVGYCQGLSFVAGILLLHMNEDEAFEMMKHLLFFQGLRKQYTPDMSALQMQLYKLTRLVYDFHRDLYEHFDRYDISPTLYAAPWFLTLFASQFTIGFVARLFDLIFIYGLEAVFRVSLTLLAYFKDNLMRCQSFESIMDHIKNYMPTMDSAQMEDVFNIVFTLDISKQLILYETEYTILKEEAQFANANASRASPSQQRNKVLVSKEVSTETFSDIIERMKELEIENKNLRRELMEVTDQLHVSQSTVHSLESSLDNYKSTIKRLEDRSRAAKDEHETLLESYNILRRRLEKLQASAASESESQPSDTGRNAPILSVGAVSSERTAENDQQIDEENCEDESEVHSDN
ncbi:TBC1 domain family member 4-like protein, partial [Dinothrombium tinctorium]